VGRYVYRKRILGMAGFGWGFAAVFGVFVAVAVAGVAGDDAAGAAQAGRIGVGGAALDTADAAVLGVVGEHGFAIIGGVFGRSRRCRARNFGGVPRPPDPAARGLLNPESDWRCRRRLSPERAPRSLPNPKQNTPRTALSAKLRCSSLPVDPGAVSRLG